MKKQISSSMLYVVIGYVLLSLFLFLWLVIFVYEVIPILKGSKDSSTIVMFLCLSALYFLVFWLWNRLNCWIWIEDGYIKRRGLWFGFEKEIKISDIERVETSYFGRGGEYLNLITNEEGSIYRTSKYSYISFLHTKKNLKFLKTFWDGPIDGHVRWKSQL